MSNNHYVVSSLSSGWQWSHRGEVTGPIDTREAAIASAIAAATASKAPDTEVVVSDADMRTETVWRAGAASAS